MRIERGNYGHAQHARSQTPTLYVGIGVSLFLNIVALAYSAGSLGNRVDTVERTIASMQTHGEKTDDVLTQIQVTLKSVDDRLSYIADIRSNDARRKTRN